MTEIYDYVAGTISHEEFEAELYIHPDLWDEIQSLIPADISGPDCPFRRKWGNMQALETNNYKVKAAVTAFGFNSGMLYSLLKALVLYHDPNAVCHTSMEDSAPDILEVLHLDYIGGTEVDNIVNEIITGTATKKEMKKKLLEAFPRLSKKHPDWVQEPEWPATDGIPMTFVEQSHNGEKHEYVFCNPKTGVKKTIVQFS